MENDGGGDQRRETMQLSANEQLVQDVGKMEKK